MKRCFALLLCALLVLPLCACKPENSDNTPQASGATDPFETTLQTEPSEPTAEFEIPDDATALSAQDLEWFNTVFFNGENPDGDPLNLHNKFLLPEYDAPEMIDLRSVFYDGVSMNTQITQEEIDLFEQTTGRESGLDKFKVRKVDMERIFLENTGLTVAQSKQVGLDKMTYLEAYDAYYMEHGDTGYMVYQIEGGYETDYGLTVLYYRDKLGNSNERWQVTLQKQDDGYWFVSNHPAA